MVFVRHLAIADIFYVVIRIFPTVTVHFARGYVIWFYVNNMLIIWFYVNFMLMIWFYVKLGCFLSQNISIKFGKPIN